jgi:hypothetical protein
MGFEDSTSTWKALSSKIVRKAKKRRAEQRQMLFWASITSRDASSFHLPTILVLRTLVRVCE